MKRPVGIAEQFASEKDEVCLAGPDDLVCLGWFGDHADGGGGDLGFAVDGVGVVNLVAGAYGNLLGRVIAAGGDVYEIDLCLLKEFREGDGLGEIPAWTERLWGPVGRGDSDEERKVWGPCGADGANDLEGETYAIFEASPIFVSAMVGERGEELVQEVAVCGVDFDQVEACGKGTVGGCYEVGDDLVHASAVEGGGEGVGLVEADGGGGYGLPTAFGRGHGADWLPGKGHAGFAAGVGQLGSCVGAVLVEEGGDAVELWDVLVFPDAEVAGGDAGFGADCVCLGDDESSAANGAASEVDEVPIVGKTVDRGVFAHGGDCDSVGKSEAAELERSEEVVNWLSHSYWMWRSGFGCGGLELCAGIKSCCGVCKGFWEKLQFFVVFSW